MQIRRMMRATISQAPLNEGQLHLLKVFSFTKNEDDLKELQAVLFSLLQVLKNRLKNVDFIVNFAIGTDFNRNIGNAIQSPDTHQNVINKYKTFLGSEDFFNNPQIKTAS
jgi:hypothetical protein